MIQPTHELWQQQVVDLAHMLGWNHLHVRRSIGRGRKWVTATNAIGWPDLLLWSPRHGVAAIELKVKPDKPTDEQTAVLASLAAAGVRTMVAYPEDTGRGHGATPRAACTGVNTTRANPATVFGVTRPEEARHNGQAALRG